jgi:hypothetical protein
MIPTVHLNGTSREELCLQLQRADDALLAAYEALSATAPHGRDYYPQGEDAIVKATAEHRSRLRRLIGRSSTRSSRCGMASTRRQKRRGCKAPFRRHFGLCEGAQYKPPVAAVNNERPGHTRRG